jgi:tRNA1Val (adenine37-N6)-methyltransferase
MKVCTDACILGAWFSSRAGRYKNILDIGSGTGLQMLMLAQKTDGLIHGIEIDSSAFEQLKENLADSPWSHRLAAFRGDVRTFAFTQKYDFIISNPPFYENDLLSPSGGRQLAMHSSELTLQQLLAVIDSNLQSTGEFGLLLPHHRTAYFHTLASETGFYLKEKISVKQSPSHNPFRTIVWYSKARNPHPLESQLTIHDEQRHYTREFADLLRDYYLKL